MVWVQARIAEDPTLLGLGDLVLKDRERPQPRAGRLDLLLQDPETSRPLPPGHMLPESFSTGFPSEAEMARRREGV